MGYAKNNNSMVGKYVTITREVCSCAGYFTSGSRVKIVGESCRGYDIEDEYGNKVTECGYGFFNKNLVGE